MELFLFVFVFFYPVFMAIYWTTGALIFFNRRESRNAKRPELKTHPKVAILVPCHNEASCVRDALLQLSKNHYPSFEIIAINDGSTDRTGEILNELTGEIEKLKAKGIAPGLAGVLVGDDPASALYVSMKEKACKKLGIYFEKIVKPNEYPENELLELRKRFLR